MAMLFLTYESIIYLIHTSEKRLTRRGAVLAMNVLSFIHFVRNIHLLIALFHVTIACKCIHRVE